MGLRARDLHTRTLQAVLQPKKLLWLCKVLYSTEHSALYLFILDIGELYVLSDARNRTLFFLNCGEFTHSFHNFL